MVVAYIMKTRNQSLIDALSYVQSRRTFVMPNQGFIKQLNKFQSELQKENIAYNIQTKIILTQEEEQKSEKNLLVKKKKRSINLIIKPADDDINIIGSVYLGDIRAAQNIEILHELDITSVLTVADYPSLGFKSPMEHFLIPAKDEVNYNIRKNFKAGLRFIRNCLMNGNVLVHSMAGVSRSGAMVVAYIMKYEFKTYTDAL